MPPKPLITAAAFCLMAPSAYALDAAQCGEIEAQAFTVLHTDLNIEVTQSATSAAHAMPNGCASSNLEIYVQDIGLMFHAERMVFTGDNLIEWMRGQATLPTQLQLRLDGVTLTDRFAPTPDLAWLTDLVGPDQPAQIDVQWTWSEDSQQLTLDFAQVDFGSDNSVTLQFDAQAYGWQPYNTPSQDLGMTRIGVTASLNGLFDQAVVAPLTANGVDMSPFSVAFMAAGVQTLVANAPPGLLSMQSGAEIVAFMQTLPAPRGVLQLNLFSPTPFNVDRVLSDLRSGIPFDTAVPQGLNINTRWTPFN